MCITSMLDGLCGKIMYIYSYSHTFTYVHIHACTYIHMHAYLIACLLCLGQDKLNISVLGCCKEIDNSLRSRTNPHTFWLHMQSVVSCVKETDNHFRVECIISEMYCTAGGGW